jgi:membrane protease subunit (stomatin/prohibitin family)
VKTENIPLLNKIINLPFGGKSPFQAEVWYVNLLSKLDNKWGTTNPILLEDPKYGIIIPVRAFGQFGFKISNPRLFLETLTGNLPSFSAEKIQDYFKGKIISSLTSLISKKIVRENISILEINVSGRIISFLPRKYF